ncbi:hypothetical protein FRAAL4589 [Frankia alni ACN14a]|uniref:Uncharacterized protein n=1 Tax=Frankia alni (strain DSM 45986 / CECT 9034 / ACN14a) TaxID=326424 RepID=Q0RH04_FRAAA|nr:hypothetical protein FRAAL4589 [Frankia alni ACN14a]
MLTMRHLVDSGHFASWINAISDKGPLVVQRAEVRSTMPERPWNNRGVAPSGSHAGDGAGLAPRGCPNGGAARTV